VARITAVRDYQVHRDFFFGFLAISWRISCTSFGNSLMFGILPRRRASVALESPSMPKMSVNAVLLNGVSFACPNCSMLLSMIVCSISSGLVSSFHCSFCFCLSLFLRFHS
jgi:hypothetical protein